ncbi:MAG: hypothetical protein H6738_13175 [Alphaproteobacteria bacterium]|nr:hypothetical protein [Alphaproteobacteria bacterium]MCB9697728.1 hypothetical protein [Alphaproteobacteria bacterium]
MPELDDILPSLTPPPGGLHALRERLDHRRRRAVWWVGLVPLGAAALALALLWPRAEVLSLPEDPVLLTAVPSEPVTVPAEVAASVAVARVPVEGLVWYRVGSTLPPAEPSR